jgi:16S rRNA (uracil1498-N3)-methyltransferase
MPHFFVPPAQLSASRFALEKEESRHLIRVLRKKTGDEVALFDGAGRTAQGRITAVNSGIVEGEVLSAATSAALPYRLRLFQALPKGAKFEFVIEKMVEAGCAEIIPFLSERTEAAFSDDKTTAKVGRWQKIILAAAKQCGQTRLPAIAAPVAFDAALKMLAFDAVSVIPWESEAAVSLKDILRGPNWPKNPARPPVVNVMIGPEGGFSPAEIERARAAGARPVTLGPLILRTETAGFFAAAALLYEKGVNG